LGYFFNEAMRPLFKVSGEPYTGDDGAGSAPDLMKYDLIIADPAKNISAFVLNRRPSEMTAAFRAALSEALLADPALGAEQAAFVLPPGQEGNRHWRLEMMGGEFCGNAARSLGLYVAVKTGLQGRHRIVIESSGLSVPVPVRTDTETGRAEADIPGPSAMTSLNFEGRMLPVCVFEGITHVLAPELEPDREIFFALKAAFERNAPSLPGALGVLFAGSPAGEAAADAASPPDAADIAMTPAVYVYGTDSLVFESSCGSGSAALAVYGSRNLSDGEGRYRIIQPGGIIEARVVKLAGAVVSVSIGGTVTLRELVWEWEKQPDIDIKH
jgi:diaminopimelate epimerase